MIERVNDNNYKEYETFLASHPKGLFCHTRNWGKVKSSWKWEAIMAKDEQGNIKGAGSVLIRFVPVIKCSLLYVCRGFACDTEDLETFDELLEGIKQIAKENKGYVIKIDPEITVEHTAFAEHLNKLGFKRLPTGLDFENVQARFVYVFDYKYLEKIKEDKFSILDTIKDISINKVQVTLSIAISNDGLTNKEKYKTAQAAMDVILGRGGDQATIRENDKYIFFGGRTTEFEKRTKVKARIVAHALEELIKETDQVMIMGHNNPDIDAIGSALGISRLAKSLDKKVNIVASTEGLALKELLQSLSEDQEYEGLIINKEIAENEITPETLLVVVDTNKISHVEAPELLDKTSRIAIIDHHRRSTDFIKDSILTFHEVYASSAAELVTEVLQYTEEQPKLTTLEAEALYAGIMMDTKNFTFKTGVRTFEAAAYLRRYGIDIIKVKKWFQSDLETYKKITNIIDKTEIIRDTIGISTYESEDKDAGVVCAKAADELLTIGNITTSFVLGNVGDMISISGRSIGEINVQLILEKMGGGGHSTVAGVQIQGKTIEEAKQELIKKIDEYFEETES